MPNNIRKLDEYEGDQILLKISLALHLCPKSYLTVNLWKSS